MYHELLVDGQRAEEPLREQSDRDGFEPAVDDIEREHQFLVEWEVPQPS